MAHEQSITISIDNKHYNIPSVVNGKKLSDKAATDYAIKNKKLGKTFKDIPSAVKAAKLRSKSFDKKVDKKKVTKNVPKKKK